jgi:predicted hydrocarbon binding protein
MSQVETEEVFGPIVRIDTRNRTVTVGDTLVHFRHGLFHQVLEHFVVGRYVTLEYRMDAMGLRHAKSVVGRVNPYVI